MQRFVLNPQTFRTPINLGAIGARVFNQGPGSLLYYDDADALSATATVASGSSVVLAGSWYFAASGSAAVITVVEIAGPSPAMEVWRNTAQSIPNNTMTDITWEDGASNGERAQGLFVLASPTLVTFRETGMYLVTLSVDFASNATGRRYVNIFKTNWDGNVAAAAIEAPAASGVDTRLQVHTHLKVDGQIATPAIKAQVLQTSGGALNLPSNFNTTGFAPVLQVMRVSDYYDRGA